MAYNPTVTVDISINAVNLTEQGFGTPLFICTHQEFDERTREYSSLDEIVEDFGTKHFATVAATQFFKNRPSPKTIKIGRRVGEYQLIPSIRSDGAETTYVVTVNPNKESLSNFSASVTNDNITVSGREAVCDALIAALEGLVGFSENFEITKSGTGDSATLKLTSKDVESTFKVETAATGGEAGEAPTFTNLLVGTEAPVESLAKIKEYDNDFYFITHEDRPLPQNIQGLKDLSEAVEADTKMYFVASAQAEDITSEDPLVSFFYHLFNAKYNRTVTFWHHEAEDFPECYYVGYNSPFNAGTVTWCNLVVNGLAPSAQPNNTAKPLTTTQLSKLLDRKINFVQRDAGINIIRQGTSASGEWIDVIRGVDWLTEDMTVSLKTLLFNQKGKKIPYNNTGIAQVREVMTSSLQRAVNRQFLTSYEVTIPLLGQDGAGYKDFVDRALRQAKFVGILAGAIHTIEVQGQVTPPSDEV